MNRKRVKRRGKDSFEPRKTYVKGVLYWQVNLPIEYKVVDGKRVRVQKRRTLKNPQEAETIAEQARIQAKNDGRRSFTIPDEVRRDALASVRELEPFGVTILDAAKFYAKHLRQIRTSEKVSAAVKEFLNARDHDELRPRYLKDLRVRLTRFSQSFGERTIADISAGEINTWLRGFKPFNTNTFRLRISTLFSYAIERGWRQDNPVAKVKKVKASAAIGILTPEQFAKLLEVASEETLPYWLLGGFAGLRRAEIERLEWNDIRFDLAKYTAFINAADRAKERHQDSEVEKEAQEAALVAQKEWRAGALIEVPALKAKTASRRFVPIQDSLAAWLQPYIGRKGTVCPANLRKLLETDRTNAKLTDWPSNALRHGFASYHLAHFKNAALLAVELGHTDQELIFRCYRELVKPDEAEKYWNIQPAAPPNLVAIVA